MARTEQLEQWGSDDRWRRVEQVLLPGVDAGARSAILARLRELLNGVAVDPSCAGSEAAAAEDRADPALLVREARELLAAGYLAEAELPLSRALLAQVDAPGAYNVAAELALAGGRWADAGTIAELAWALSGGSVDCAQIVATAAERCDDRSSAREWLERAAVASPQAIEPRIRLLRQHVDRGAWQAALDLAGELPRLAPARPIGWVVASWTRLAAGDSVGAFDAALMGLRRCGGSYELVARAVASAAQLAVGRDEAIELLFGLLSQNDEGQLALLEELVDHGLYRAGRALAERLGEAAGGSLALWAAVARAHRLMKQPEQLTRAQQRVEPHLRREPASSSDVTALALHAALLRRAGWPEQARAVLGGRPVAERRSLDVALELARCHAACGDAASALALLDARDSESAGAPPTRVLMVSLTLAEDLGEWPRAVQLSQRLLAATNRDTADGYQDPWPLRARLAGAQLALGDETPRRVLLEQAPAHALASLELLRVERRAGHPLAEVDAERLKVLAAPLLEAVDHRPW
jgi:tetratricopeptide (TPR) repeat protein